MSEDFLSFGDEPVKGSLSARSAKNIPWATAADLECRENPLPQCHHGGKKEGIISRISIIIIIIIIIICIIVFVVVVVISSNSSLECLL